MPFRLRAARRAALVLLVIPGGYVALLAGRLLAAPFPRLRERFTAWYFRRWSAAVMASIGLAVRAEGAPPPPPFLLVANHLSYVDILVLASRLGCVFVSKAEVRGWPLLGPICRTLGTIFIDREARRDIPRVMVAIERELAAGRGVVIFPEGTSSAGRTVEPFKPSLLALATRLGRPVHYAVLRYETPSGEPTAHEVVCWWGGIPFASHAWRLLQPTKIEATLRFAPEPILEPDRKLLAERLRQAILADFEPMAPPAEEGMAGPGVEDAEG